MSAWYAVAVLWLLAGIITCWPHLLDWVDWLLGREHVMSGRCPVCGGTFEGCRCTYHDPQSCGLCVPLLHRLQHPVYGGARPFIPRQGRAS